MLTELHRAPPCRSISYVSGAVDQLVIERTTILMADVKTPIVRRGGGGWVRGA